MWIKKNTVLRIIQIIRNANNSKNWPRQTKRPCYITNNTLFIPSAVLTWTPECSVSTAHSKSCPSWIHLPAASAITMTTTKTCDLRPTCPTEARSHPYNQRGSSKRKACVWTLAFQMNIARPLSLSLSSSSSLIFTSLFFVVRSFLCYLQKSANCHFFLC